MAEMMTLNATVREVTGKSDVKRLRLEGIVPGVFYKSGEEPVSLQFDKKDLDLITTTLDMPVLDGYALLFELSKKNPKAKIAFISEDTTKGVIEDLLKMGAADYILKPIERVRILKRIKQVLDK